MKKPPKLGQKRLKISLDFFNKNGDFSFSKNSNSNFSIGRPLLITSGWVCRFELHLRRKDST